MKRYGWLSLISPMGIHLGLVRLLHLLYLRYLWPMLVTVELAMARERRKTVEKGKRLKAMKGWGTDGMTRPKLNWMLSWMDQVTLDQTQEGTSTNP